MTSSGHSKHYDEITGTGFTRPEDCNDPIPSNRSEMSADGERPKEESRVRFEIEGSKPGEPQAVELQKA